MNPKPKQEVSPQCVALPSCVSAAFSQYIQETYETHVTAQLAAAGP